MKRISKLLLNDNEEEFWTAKGAVKNTKTRHLFIIKTIQHAIFIGRKFRHKLRDTTTIIGFL